MYMNICTVMTPCLSCSEIYHTEVKLRRMGRRMYMCVQCVVHVINADSSYLCAHSHNDQAEQLYIVVNFVIKCRKVSMTIEPKRPLLMHLSKEILYMTLYSV